MHRLLLVILTALSVSVNTLGAQGNDESSAPTGDTARPTPDVPTLPDESSPAPMSDEEVEETVRGLNERATLLEQEVAGIKAIKIGGYVQTEWQHFDQSTSAGGRAFYSDARKNVFTVRRGRIKFQHKLGDVMSYTIQPDITEAGVSIKDAFLSLNFFTNDELRLDAGMFNRPNYEVELSSSTRESTERSQVVRAFYPGERDLGVMFSSRLEVAEGFDPRMQLGLFNGPGTRTELDAVKDIIGRLVLPLPLGSDSPVQVDLGASYYYGGIPQKGSTIQVWENDSSMIVENTESGGMAGFGNNRNFGIEGQVYLDVLPFGGTIIRGEFLSGQRATAGASATSATVGIVKDSGGKDSIRIVPATAATPLTIRNQMGYYIYLVQNISSDFQLVAKYDRFDRNTDQSASKVVASTESAASVLGIGMNYFYENLRFTLYYEMPAFAEDEAVQIDPATRKPIDDLRNVDAKDNKTTFRIQYKF